MNPLPEAAPPWFAALQKLRSSFATEAAMQRAVGGILPAHATREHRLDDESRIDFTVEHEGRLWGIECKTQPHGADVLRQLTRYALHVDVLVLVSTKAVRLPYPVKTLDGTGKTVPLHIIETWCNL